MGSTIGSGGTTRNSISKTRKKQQQQQQQNNSSKYNACDVWSTNASLEEEENKQHPAVFWAGFPEPCSADKKKCAPTSHCPLPPPPSLFTPLPTNTPPPPHPRRSQEEVTLSACSSIPPSNTPLILVLSGLFVGAPTAAIPPPYPDLHPPPKKIPPSLSSLHCAIAMRASLFPTPPSLPPSIPLCTLRTVTHNNPPPLSLSPQSTRNLPSRLLCLMYFS